MAEYEEKNQADVVDLGGTFGQNNASKPVEEPEKKKVPSTGDLDSGAAFVTTNSSSSRRPAAGPGSRRP